MNEKGQFRAVTDNTEADTETSLSTQSQSQWSQCEGRSASRVLGPWNKEGRAIESVLCNCEPLGLKGILLFWQYLFQATQRKELLPLGH